MKETIVIQEPPIQELKKYQKRSSCLRRLFFLVIGTGIFSVIIGGIIIRFFIISYPKTLDNVPNIVNSTVPIYHTASVSSVRFVSGKKQEDMMNDIAYIPRIIATPISFVFSLTERMQKHNEPIATSSKAAWNSVLDALNNSLVDTRDVYRIEWKYQKASQSFIASYFIEELTERSFDVSTKIKKNITEIIFHKKTINGTITITESNGTNSIELTLYIPTTYGN